MEQGVGWTHMQSPPLCARAHRECEQAVGRSFGVQSLRGVAWNRVHRSIAEGGRGRRFCCRACDVKPDIITLAILALALRPLGGCEAASGGAACGGVQLALECQTAIVDVAVGLQGVGAAGGLRQGHGFTGHQVVYVHAVEHFPQLGVHVGW